MSNAIPLPPKAEQRIRKTMETIDEMQRSAGAFLEGVATILEVPQGYTFDQEQMAFVAPQVAPPLPDSDISGAEHPVPDYSTLNGVPEHDEIMG